MIKLLGFLNHINYLRMKINKGTWIICLLFFCGGMAKAQLYSFEENAVPDEWSIENGTFEISQMKAKLGKQSLKVNWNSGAVIHFANADNLEAASKSANGGVAAWIYNEFPVEEAICFSFNDKEGKEVCNLPFLMNFKGWRCIWAKFVEDMSMKPKTVITSCRIKVPQKMKAGTFYLDYVEFAPTISWQKMSDAQYLVNQKDYSLIHDFLGYRNTEPQLSGVVFKEENKQGIEVIKNRLTEWYLGEEGGGESHPLLQIRAKGEKEYIRKGIERTKELKVGYDKTGTATGKGLFPLYASDKIDGEDVFHFMDINKFVLLPLALDYRKNESTQSLQKALYIYDWFYDQGWADGSGMGTLCFEKLRSSGYFHSFFLLKDKLTKAQLERELKSLKWFTLFGECYRKPEHTGEVADNLRALALPKLIYALSLTNPLEQQGAMEAYKNYLNNALDFGPGFFGTIKPDYSGYHHRGPYNSAYYPHALYAASLIAYLLHDTPYAISETSLDHLKQALLTFRFFSANLSVPAGTVGRFPKGQEIMQELLPAFCYVAQSYKETDVELVAAFKRLVNENPKVVNEFMANVNSDLTYTSSIGEAEAMVEALCMDVEAEKMAVGTLFMPYSGLLVAKNENYHINVKGFSKYIWDYESSPTENLQGRYLSYGQVEFFHFKKQTKSYYPEHPQFNWNYLSGTTSIVLDDFASENGFHRNFSDETFLCGVSARDQKAMFSMKLHDLKFNDSFRANKSVFVMGDVLLCLGSDIQNNDMQHPTVTTLFQTISSRNKKVGKEALGTGVLLDDYSGILYAVKGAECQLQTNASFHVATINHSKAPQKATYHYYLIADGNRETAKRLLSHQSPVQVVRQDRIAHIVRNNESNTTYAALFNSEHTFETMLVRKVNIPLSYIIEEKEGKQMQLFFSEPDMRRPSKINMDGLTESEVVQEEQPFETEFILNGNYQVDSPVTPVKVLYENGNTTVRVTTIRGNNYMFNLQKKDQ